MGDNRDLISLAAPTSFGAIFYTLPIAYPFFAPYKWEPTTCANLARQVGFLHTFWHRLLLLFIALSVR